MKQKFFLVVACLILIGGSIAAQTTFTYWFKKSNVDFYYKNTSENDHISLKIVNHNTSSVKVSFNLQWFYNGIMVGDSGSGDTYTVGSGDYVDGNSGCYFYAPKGYKVSSLKFQLAGLKIISK